MSETSPSQQRAWTLYGHRGARAEFPENTMRAFERAIEVGADALETDVHVTADGKVVVAHDDDGVRMANTPEPINQSTFEEVSKWDAGWGFVDEQGSRPFKDQGFHIPLLADVFDAFPDTLMNIDIKAPGALVAQTVVEAVRAAKAEHRTLLTSFRSETINTVKRLGYEGETGCGQLEVIRLAFLPRSIQRIIGRPGHRAQLPTHYGPLRFASESFISKCHDIGMQVDFWTINDPVEAAQLIALGADGIVTDDPARLASALADI